MGNRENERTPAASTPPPKEVRALPREDGSGGKEGHGHSRNASPRPISASNLLRSLLSSLAPQVVQQLPSFSIALLIPKQALGVTIRLERWRDNVGYWIDARARQMSEAVRRLRKSILTGIMTMIREVCHCNVLGQALPEAFTPQSKLRPSVLVAPASARKKPVAFGMGLPSIWV